MTPEQINIARAWLADPRAAPMPEDITDTIEEALEIAMERVLTEIKDAAAREEWQRLSSQLGQGK